MAKTFHLTIARIGENVFDGEVVSLAVPGVEGDCVLLAHHEPFVSELREGSLHFVDAEGKRHQVPVSRGGIVEASFNQSTVLL